MTEFERQERLAIKRDRRRELLRFEGGGDNIRYCVCRSCDLATDIVVIEGRPTCRWCGREVDPEYHGNLTAKPAPVISDRRAQKAATRCCKQRIAS
jgi:hypothetical protein